jgi:hypothetical protein
MTTNVIEAVLCGFTTVLISCTQRSIGCLNQ